MEARDMLKLSTANNRVEVDHKSARRSRGELIKVPGTIDLPEGKQKGRESFLRMSKWQISLNPGVRYFRATSQ
jgi:hypothetical protein